MLHLLAPPRIDLYPGIAARVVRGASGSTIAHVLLAVLLVAIGRAATAPPALPRAPRVVSLGSLPARAAAPPRREPETPFRDRPDEHTPATLPLTVRNYVSGD